MFVEMNHRNSFYPDSVRSWNKIGSVLRNSINLKSFKTNILALVRPKSKSIFDIHNKRLYQLRVGLSPLHDHKWTHKFSDTLSNKCVTCNRPENLEHYFLHCTRFVEARCTLLSFIMTLNIVNFGQSSSKDKIKLLLYGDTSLGNVVNKFVLEATIKFLNDSDRFL